MPVKRNQPIKNILFWLAAGIVVITLWSVFQAREMADSNAPFSQFINGAEAQRVEKVTIEGVNVTGQFRKDGTRAACPSGRTNGFQSASSSRKTRPRSTTAGSK